MPQRTRQASCLLVVLLSLAGLVAMPAGARAAGETRARPLYEAAWQGMAIRITVGPAEEFVIPQGTVFRPVTAAPGDSLHLMVDLADRETGQPVPYAAVWATIHDGAGRVVFDERLWPMISPGMGVHYGANVALPAPGRYELRVQVGPPQLARHDEYTSRWMEPRTFTARFAWPL